MRKSPLAIVKERFGDKQKLVEAVQKFVNNQELWVSRLNQKKGLDSVSNAKLLRLLNVFETVQSKWGSREKLVDAILTEEKRTKDAPYKTKMLTYPIPRLYDYYKSTVKRTKSTVKKVEQTTAKPPAAAKPTQAATPTTAKKATSSTAKPKTTKK